jgi:hypothetical protein
MAAANRKARLVQKKKQTNKSRESTAEVFVTVSDDYFSLLLISFMSSCGDLFVVT